MGTIGHNQINMCREYPPDAVPVGEEFKLEGPPSPIKVCVEMGNKTAPQGTIGKLFDFLATIAPFVALAFGVPAL